VGRSARLADQGKLARHLLNRLVLYEVGKWTIQGILNFSVHIDIGGHGRETRVGRSIVISDQMSGATGLMDRV
jgi:hypothetical protein